MIVSELLDLLREVEDNGHGDAVVLVDGMDVSDLYYDDPADVVSLTLYSPLPDLMPEDDDVDELDMDDDFYYDEYDDEQDSYGGTD